ncbi:MAG: hypothetical protein D6732_29625 [Methanobacteriota archaeon]|nr:MAG: hypothetical protein D6732_29625 [Euryarchaeota archaeon]
MGFPLFSSLVLLIEIVLVIVIGLGSYYGRLLDIDLHHRLIYPAIFIQFVIVAFWMIPNVFFLREDPESPLGSFGKIVLMLHALFGFIAILVSIYLAVYFLIFRRKWEIGNLALQRKIMIFALYIWVIAFILGILVYGGILFGY